MYKCKKCHNTFDLKKKAAISGQVVNNILKLIQQTGGATYNLSKGNLVGTPHYAVAVHPNREQILEKQIDFDDVEQYLDRNQDLLEHPENSFGAWVNGNKVYLDIINVVKDKEKAMQIARQHKQLAIFDLRNLVELPVEKVAKLAAAVSDSEQQKYYDKIYSDRWRDDSTPLDAGNEYYKGWSELGSNDFPNPKDIEKEHVYPYLLNKGPDRGQPEGLPWYEITYYDSSPTVGDPGGF